MEVRLELTFAVVWLTVLDNVIVQTPPVLRWTLGKTLNEVIAYYDERKQYINAIALDSVQHNT